MVLRTVTPLFQAPGCSQQYEAFPIRNIKNRCGIFDPSFLRYAFLVDERVSNSLVKASAGLFHHSGRVVFVLCKLECSSTVFIFIFRRP